MDKRVRSAREAIQDVGDGAVIHMGGFGLCGNPENLIAALKAKGTKDLTLVSNNAGLNDKGIGALIGNDQVRKMIMCYAGNCKVLEDRALKGEIEVEWNPQGTLAERIRAAGAGIAGFYTPTGVGTPVTEDQEIREFDGKPYVLALPLKADFAFVKAQKGDRFGNLVYRKTARNFNAVMATAAKITIAEVEELVEPEDMDPEMIHTPGVYVRRIFKGGSYEKPIEKLTVRKRARG